MDVIGLVRGAITLDRGDTPLSGTACMIAIAIDVVSFHRRAVSSATR